MVSRKNEVCHGLSFTFVALGMCHRSFGVRLEALGKHSQQLVYPGIVPIGAAISQNSLVRLKFCCLGTSAPRNVKSARTTS